MIMNGRENRHEMGILRLVTCYAVSFNNLFHMAFLLESRIFKG